MYGMVFHGFPEGGNPAMRIADQNFAGVLIHTLSGGNASDEGSSTKKRAVQECDNGLLTHSLGWASSGDENMA